MIARKFSRPPARAALLKLISAALNNMKATNIKVMDVREVTDIADAMVIASGNSDRHVSSIADRVVQMAKAAGFQPFGVEGAREGEWVLVDLNDVIVHVMLPRVREFYGLEGLWEPLLKPKAKTVAKAPARRKAKTALRKPAAAPKAKSKSKSAPRKTARPAARKAAPRR